MHGHGARDRREVALELLQVLNVSAPQFRMRVTRATDPDRAAELLRGYVGVSRQEQLPWKTVYEALDGWRRALEAAAVLVFQATRVDIDEMRGFPFAESSLPVVVVNSADTPLGRVFSLVHELTHVAFRAGGVCDMVDMASRPPEEQSLEVFCNRVARVFPALWEEIRTFARTKSTGEHEEFQLSHTWRERSRVRELISAIRADESRIVRETLSLLEPYRGDTGPLSINVYFTAGGVSDGFVFDDQREPAFYANLTRAGGDLNDVVGNLAHEAYHVMQKAAQRRAGLRAVADSTAALPEEERLLAVTLAEGVANYVVDPTCSPSIRSEQSGESVDRYLRNAKPRRIKRNFALFDEVLADLGAGRITWEEAYERGFTGTDPRFYFVGYEMAKAIERHCGTACIPRLFQQPPVEFFRQYIALYREHPEIRWRFAPETERYLMSLR